MIIALVLFFLVYLLMLSFPKYKHYIAFLFAIIFILIKKITFIGALKAIDYNILLMLLGTMGTVSLFIESNMPSELSEYIIDKVPNVKWLTICLAIFSAIISAFVDNVATVLMIVPVTIIVAKKINVSPVPIVLAVSIFSNLEGAATLVGDTTSILLAGAMKMDFLDFFWYKGKIGLFFIVQFGLIAAALIVGFLQRKNTQEIKSNFDTVVKDYVPSYLLIGTIITLIVASFINNKPTLTNGYICMAFFILGLLIKIIKDRSFKGIIGNIQEIDYSTLLLLASLFIIIKSIENAGVISKIGELFINMGSNDIFVLYTLIVFVSVLVSAFIDNIPYVATMLPVVSAVSLSIGIDPIVLYYGLIIGATLGGNITPIGASANITSIGILRKSGYQITNKEYFKYSIPISLAAILTGYLIVLLLF